MQNLSPWGLFLFGRWASLMIPTQMKENNVKKCSPLDQPLLGQTTLVAQNILSPSKKVGCWTDPQQRETFDGQSHTTIFDDAQVSLYTRSQLWLSTFCQIFHHLQSFYSDKWEVATPLCLPSLHMQHKLFTASISCRLHFLIWQWSDLKGNNALSLRCGNFWRSSDLQTKKSPTTGIAQGENQLGIRNGLVSSLS